MLNKTPEFDRYYIAYLKDDPAKEPIAASYSAPGRAKGDFELRQISKEEFGILENFVR